MDLDQSTGRISEESDNGGVNHNSSVYLGTISIRNDESYAERRMRRLNRSKNGFRVAVTSDGGRVRKSSRILSYRINLNGVCSDHLFCRVEGRVLSRIEAMRLKRELAVQVAVRPVGKFRMQCTYSGGRTAREMNRSEDAISRRIWKEVVCVEEIIVEEGEGHMRNRRNGGIRNEGSSNMLTGIGRRSAPVKKKRRSRKRRMISVEDFYLFNLDTGAVVGRQVEQGTRIGMDETERFESSVDECLQCLSKLYTKWTEIPFFRCSGGRRRNHKFCCVMTLRLRSRTEEGLSLYSVIISSVIEEDGGKIRNITLRAEKLYDGNGNCVKETQVAMCSCSVQVIDGDVTESTCWHVAAVKRN